MALISLTIIHRTINWENTHERNGCHAPLISDYSRASKCLLVRKCDVALERYRTLYLSPADFTTFLMFLHHFQLSSEIAYLLIYLDNPTVRGLYFTINIELFRVLR